MWKVGQRPNVNILFEFVQWFEASGGSKKGITHRHMEACMFYIIKVKATISARILTLYHICVIYKFWKQDFCNFLGWEPNPVWQRHIVRHIIYRMLQQLLLIIVLKKKIAIYMHTFKWYILFFTKSWSSAFNEVKLN